MKRKLFVIFVLAAAGIATMLIWGGIARAQTPKPPTPKAVPQPVPLTPLTNMTQEPDWSFSAWCGGDLINYRTEWYMESGVEKARFRVQWFHVDPRAQVSRSFGYAVYDKDGNLRVSAITPLMGPGDSTTPTTFTEDPSGFWRAYVHRTGVVFRATDHPGVNPITVMFFFRNRNAVCPLRQTFWFGGKGWASA